MALQKAISKKKKSFFQEKVEKNANNSKDLWKAFKFLGIKSSKVNQSQITLEMMVLFHLDLRKLEILLRISTLI